MNLEDIKKFRLLLVEHSILMAKLALHEEVSNDDLKKHESIIKEYNIILNKYSKKRPKYVKNIYHSKGFDIIKLNNDETISVGDKYALITDRDTDLKEDFIKGNYFERKEVPAERAENTDKNEKKSD